MLDRKTGEIVGEERVATTRKAPGEVSSRVVMENGTHSPWISRLAASHGHEAIHALPAHERAAGREGLPRTARVMLCLLDDLAHDDPDLGRRLGDVSD